MKLNVLDLPKDDYNGGVSSLCPGCGHDQISKVIIEAAWESGIPPQKIAKMSGIGCSSKTPAYFLKHSHGFNTVHGRMPTVTTGANLTNRSLQFIAVSGDGDTAAIGISHFIHAIRRNLDMVYIIENNGVYGLTKGQYSPTVEKGSQKRKSPKNERPQIDLCAMAINLGCTFVARSFSGSKKQLTALMKAAMSHRGTAIIDVISPCVTFNNNDESFKSYGYVKDHQTELHAYDYIPKFKPITEVEVPEGEYRDITLFDGSTLRLETIGEEHDPSDAVAALSHIHHAEADHRHVTGLLYYDPTRKTLDEQKNLPDKPLSLMSDDEIRPSEKDLEDLLADFRA